MGDVTLVFSAMGRSTSTERRREEGSASIPEAERRSAESETAESEVRMFALMFR